MSRSPVPLWQLVNELRKRAFYRSYFSRGSVDLFKKFVIGWIIEDNFTGCIPRRCPTNDLHWFCEMQQGVHKLILTDGPHSKLRGLWVLHWRFMVRQLPSGTKEHRTRNSFGQQNGESSVTVKKLLRCSFGWKIYRAMNHEVFCKIRDRNAAILRYYLVNLVSLVRNCIGGFYFHRK